MSSGFSLITSSTAVARLGWTRRGPTLVEPCSGSFLAQSAAGPQADRALTTALPIGVVLLKSSP